MAAISQTCWQHADSHCWSKVYSETERSGVESLVGECSLYSNLVQSSFLFGVGTPFPHLFF